MLAVSAVRIDSDDPLSGLEVGPRASPNTAGWHCDGSRGRLNHHDLWTLRASAHERSSCDRARLRCAGLDAQATRSSPPVIGHPDAERRRNV